MGAKFRSVFDIIGPTMIGSSSSHTADAVAIGRAAYKLSNGPIRKVTVYYYESFAKTHRGHGTDYAIAAGVQDFAPDDSRVPRAVELARQHDIDIRFVEEEGPSPIHHPNTAVLEVSNDNHSIELTACSIGGGSIEIRQFVIDNITVQPAGPLPIIVYIDHGKKHPNAVELTGVVEKIAPFYRKQSLKGPINDIYEFDIKNYMSAATIQQIEKQFKNVICL